MQELAQNRKSNTLCFDQFELVPEQRLLTRDGAPVAVGARALDLLLALARAGGEPVTKADLLRSAWPDLIVDESNLRVQIVGLRKALGEGVVASVPGGGYRLAAPLVAPQSRAEPARDRPATSSHPVANRIVGRDEVIADVVAKLSERRLVTLVGPGGIGKTTVALAAAAICARRHAFVDFGALTNPDLVASLVASSLGLPVITSDPVAAITRRLQDGDWLLVLDSCEHLVGPIALFAERLLEAAPALRLLATSREALRCGGEWVMRIAALRTPEIDQAWTVERIQTFSAIELFLERARAAFSGFRVSDADAHLVVDICRRLDGIPLALELAAARVEAFGLQGLATQISGHLEMLAGGRRTALPRHQTIIATLDWSYALLAPAERTVLARLSVFRGPFSIDDAAFVASGADTSAAALRDAIADLAAKSLLSTRSAEGRLAYRLLETTRLYAAGKLDAAGEVEATAERHAQHTLELVERAEAAWDPTAQGAWLAAHGGAINEVRAALAWRFERQADREVFADLVAASASLWFQLGLVDEGLGWFERAILVDMAPMSIRMRLNAALAHALVQARGVSPLVPQAFERCLVLARELDDTAYQGVALWGLAGEASLRGDYAAALGFAEALGPIFARSGDWEIEVIERRLIAFNTHFLGQHDRALSLAEGLLATPPVALRSGFHSQVLLDQICAMQCVQARTLWLIGRADEAKAISIQAVERAVALGNAFTEVHVLAVCACPVALWRGDDDTSALIQRLIDLTVARSLTVYLTWARAMTVALAFVPGGERPDTKSIKSLDELVMVHPHLLSPIVSQRCVDGSVGWCAPEVLRAEGVAHLEVGDVKGAAEKFAAALKLADQQGARALALRALTSLVELDPTDGLARARLRDRLAGFDQGRQTRDIVRAEALLHSA